MASTGNLQLFPPPQTKTQVAKPKRKASQRKPQADPIAERSSSPASPAAAKIQPHTEEIVIHISPSTKRSVQNATRKNSPAILASAVKVSAQPSRTASPYAASVLSETSTLVRTSSQSSEAPLVRSMFPQYNPQIPLAQQQYRPNQATLASFRRDPASKEVTKTTVMYPKSIQNLRDPTNQLSPVSAGSATFPTTIQNMPPPQYSTPQELGELWDAANGQDIGDKGRTFALRMNRDGVLDPSTNRLVATPSESYTFSTSNGSPFWDLQTIREKPDSAASECIVRRHDLRSKTAIPIVFLTLQPPSRQLPPCDGLIAEIYPKTAALMALEDAKSIASEAEAANFIRKASEKETCRLLWNHEKQKYHLYHPSLNGSKGQSFVIHFEGGTAGFDVGDAKGTIRLVNVASGENLAALEFGTATLLVNTSATAKLESLYIVDVAVTAILLVAIVEGRRVRASRSASSLTPLNQEQDSQAAVKANEKIRSKSRQKILDEETGMAKEIDAETYRPTFEFENGIEKEKTLPKPAQGTLSILFGTYRFVVWLLGIFVNALAGLVVGIATMCSDKSR